MPKVLKVDAIRKACEIGNKLACQISLRIAPQIFGGSVLSFSNIADDEDDHPNKMPFDGVLLLVDTPSTKPPHGSRGHRILVPKSVAKKRLSGLIGMGLNYEPNLQAHAPRRKVGVITEASLDGDKVRVKGFVYKKDFPEVEKDFKQGRLGMSMELANVYVRDEAADVWYLEDFHFTGATVLMKDAAAYYQTALAARAAKVVRGKGEHVMATKTKDKSSAQPTQFDALVKAVTLGVRGAMNPVTVGIQAQADALSGLRDEMQDMKELFTISAAARNDDDSDISDEDDINASEDDDIEAAGGNNFDPSEDPSDPSDPSDQDDQEDPSDHMEAMEDLEEEAVDEEPGEINKKRGDKNKGNKTTVTDPPKQGAKVPGNIANKRLSSSAAGGKKMSKPFPGLKSSAANIQAAAFIGDLKAQVRQLRASVQKRDIRAAKLEQRLTKMGNKYEVMEAQVARYAEIEGRRSVVPADLQNLAAKSNVNLTELHASGTKLTVGDMDTLLENSGFALDPVQRMTLKNKALELGLMEQGEIRRQLN